MASYNKAISIREAKVCLLGDCGVGKSSLVVQFVTGEFNHKHSPTIGASFMTRTFMVAGERSCKFQIWDTAGQERFKSLTPMYYRNCEAAIIVYDITSETTFENVKSWVKDVHQLGPANIVIAIAGNKRDLADEREVDRTKGVEYANSIGAIFTEVSALKNENINKVFEEISKRLPPIVPNEQEAKNANLNVHKQTRKNKQCC